MADYPDPDSRNVLDPGCSRCPDLADVRERIAWGNGSLDADVVVVGEAPAYGDPDADRWRGGNWTGMAYTSAHSGRRVRDLFADAGFASDDLYFTNAVKCFPRADAGADADTTSTDREPTNREPTAEERANCRDHLRAEIETVEPAAIAPTGKHATLSVLDEDGLSAGFLDSVLDPVESQEFDATVVPLLHPSYQNVWVSRLGYSREEYVDAIRKVVEQCR